MEDISVVIPTTRGESILETIQGLLQNSILPMEIIVVDQGNFLTNEFFNRFNSNVCITLLKDKGKGAARARNIGWRAAKGTVIAFTDDDAIPTELWIESHLNYHAKKDTLTGIVGGKITPLYFQRNPNWEMPKEYEYLLPTYDQGLETGEYTKEALPAGVNMSMLKVLLEKTNGFNENLGPNVGRKIQIFGEDAELAVRIKKLGLKLIYNPKAEVFHPVPLQRQNNAFLQKRIYSEGFTMAYRDCLSNHYTKTNLLYMIYNELKKQFKHRFAKKNTESMGIGFMNYSRGYLKGIINFGFLKK